MFTSVLKGRVLINNSGSEKRFLILPEMDTQQFFFFKFIIPFSGHCRVPEAEDPEAGGELSQPRVYPTSPPLRQVRYRREAIGVRARAHPTPSKARAQMYQLQFLCVGFSSTRM